VHSELETAPAASRRRIGEVLADKYELVRLIGEGGMGAVYEARHRLIGRRFAVKFLHAAHAAEPPMLGRFEREARAAGALENENLVAVTDFGFAADGAPYIVMEHLEGEDLARLLGRVGPLPVRRAVDLVVQACRGLAVAHGHGIVHRDLKPANLFVVRRNDGGDLVKVLDFGIAKLRDGAEGAGAAGAGGPVTGTGKMLGTPGFTPPEQARGERDVDQRADIYALGAILYELLSGARAHPGENYNAILFHILTQQVTPLASLRAGLPAGLTEVVHRAMAAERADRYQSADELVRALLPFGPAPAAMASARADAGALTAASAPSLAADVISAANAASSRQRARPLARPFARSTARVAGLALLAAAIAAAVVLLGRGLVVRPAPPPAQVAAPQVAAPPPAPSPPPAATVPPRTADPAPAAVASPAAAERQAVPSRPHPRRPRTSGDSRPPPVEFDPRNPYEN
jgi:serine/threonine-protein kinase